MDVLQLSVSICVICDEYQSVPVHEISNNKYVRPAKPQISLHIRAV